MRHGISNLMIPCLLTPILLGGCYCVQTLAELHSKTKISSGRPIQPYPGLLRPRSAPDCWHQPDQIKTSGVGRSASSCTTPDIGSQEAGYRLYGTKLQDIPEAETQAPLNPSKTRPTLKSLCPGQPLTGHSSCEIRVRCPTCAQAGVIRGQDSRAAEKIVPRPGWSLPPY